MIRDQVKKAIEVMQAWVDREPVEFRQRGTELGPFFTTDAKWELAWNWEDFEYRRKPVPKIVERWVVSDDKGNQMTFRFLHEARGCADAWDAIDRTGITLTPLKGEEQPWPTK